MKPATEQRIAWKYVLRLALLGCLCSRHVRADLVGFASETPAQRKRASEQHKLVDLDTLPSTTNRSWAREGDLAGADRQDNATDLSAPLMHTGQSDRLFAVVDRFDEFSDGLIDFSFNPMLRHNNRDSTRDGRRPFRIAMVDAHYGAEFDGAFRDYRDTTGGRAGSTGVLRLPPCNPKDGYPFERLGSADEDGGPIIPDLFRPQRRAAFREDRNQHATTGSQDITSLRQIDVAVTASSSGNVYLNKGRAVGIQPGDQVVLYPAGQGAVNATVQSVSAHNSRCLVVSRSTAVDIGTRGAVRIPVERLKATRREVLREKETPSNRRLVEHPPWTHPPEDWHETTPLLAPAYARNAWERETVVHGRVFGQYVHTWNGMAADDQYSLGRVGTSLWIDNPVQRGGGLHLAGEFNRRGIFLNNARDEIDVPGRLDRISYFWGGTADAPVRYEFGRLLHHEFPEFGFLDGAELVYRTKSGNRIGVSLGALPEPFPDLNTGNDLGVTVFYRFVSDEDEDFSMGLGYQKTWHRGQADRDLVIGTIDYHPNVITSLHGTIWGDFYGSGDTIKSRSFEITQALLQARVQFSPSRGVAFYLSRLRWPELLRREFSPFIDDQLRRAGVDRYGLQAWQELGDTLRLDGNVDLWRDHDRQDGIPWEVHTGVPWEVRCAVRDFFYNHGEVSLSFFETQGLYSSGPGGRISLNRYLSPCFATLAYEVASYEYGENTRAFWQQRIRANLDITLKSRNSVSLYLECPFGNHQNAVHMGIYLQKVL